MELLNIYDGCKTHKYRKNYKSGKNKNSKRKEKIMKKRIGHA